MDLFDDELPLRPGQMNAVLQKFCSDDLNSLDKRLVDQYLKPQVKAEFLSNDLSDVLRASPGVRLGIEADRLRVEFNRNVTGTVLQRVVPVLRIAEHLMGTFPGIKLNNIVANLGDGNTFPGVLSFCSNKPNLPLIPDPYFFRTKGYRAERIAYLAKYAPLETRIPKAYWRGADTGIGKGDEFMDCQRARCCLLAKDFPELIDAKITKVSKQQRTAPEIRQEAYSRAGIFGQVESQDTVLNYRYQIDIDGNTNAWGLPFKLLSGVPVLKVKSKSGHSQWYYNRLIPWVNYVPVESDLSDLPEKIKFLNENILLAQRIGLEGRRLVLEMTYDKELDLGVSVMLASALVQ